jgi:hypothetical protein
LLLLSLLAAKSSFSGLDYCSVSQSLLVKVQIFLEVVLTALVLITSFISLDIAHFHFKNITKFEKREYVLSKLGRSVGN